MKIILAIVPLALALSLCNLTDKLSGKRSDLNTGGSSDAKEERVKTRLTELFNLCREGKNSEAARYMMYLGADQSRKGRESANYANEEDRRDVDDTCRRIKNSLDESSGYEFGKFLTQQKGDGSEVVAWEVFFKKGPDRDGSIYAFKWLDDDGVYVLVDIDPIRDGNSNSSTTADVLPPPPVQPNANNRNTPPNANVPRAPISGGVMNGKAISLPKPAYPAAAKAVKASGTVTVQITVDEKGNVIEARAVSGHPLLQAAAVSAARQAKFSPTQLSGQPVKVTGILTYNFVAP